MTRIKIQLARTVGILVAVLWASSQLAQPVGAQTLAGWSAPVNISQTDGFSVMPRIAADQSGRAHVIWAERTAAEENGPTDTGYYSVLAGGNWSTPVDVLAVPYGDSFNPRVLAVDPYGRLAFVWTQNRGVNISIADAASAGAAQAWKTVQLDAGSQVNGASLAIDRHGVYHLFYVRDNHELIYVRSAAGEEDWTRPVTIASSERNDEALSGPSIAAAGDDLIYVSWTIGAESENWAPVGVNFARSSNGGMTWDPVQEIAAGGRYGSSSLLTDAQQNLHIFWLGSGSTGGRYHRWSSDRGMTWSDQIVVMPPEQISGFPGAPTLLLDSAGTVHVIFAGYSSGIEYIWHTTWDGSGWRQPTPISGDLPNSQEGWAAIGLGHLIHAAWTEYDGEDIWAASFDTGSPADEVDVAPLPEANALPPTPTALVVQEPEPAAAPETSISQRPAASAAPPPASSSTAAVLVPALAPAVLLVLIVMVVQLRRRKR